MKTVFKAIVLASLFSTVTAATIDFSTTSKISFRCQVDIYEKLVNNTNYKAYPGLKINTVIHEQYNSITTPDIKMLVDLHNGRALFSNVIIGGDGYLKWSVLETDDHAIRIDQANWPITARVLYSKRYFDHAKNKVTIAESDGYLYRVECMEVE